MKLKKAVLAGVLGLGLILVLFGVLGGSPIARAANFNVDVTNDENDGSCDPGDCSLREAIIAANDNGEADTITLGSGTYILSLAGQDEDDGATGDLDINASLTIVGAGPTERIIDADGIDRVFHIDTGVATVVISGVTIMNGSVGFSGGGIRNYDADLTLINTVVVSHMAAGYGGGIFASLGGVTVTAVKIWGNTASHGGGVHLRDISGSFTMAGGEISSNTATLHGDGIYVFNGRATLNRGQILSNTALLGGGVHVSYGRVTLDGAQINHNMADAGGGIYVAQSAGIFTQTGNSTIAYNQATDTGTNDGGGGVCVANGTGVIEGGEIVSNNTAFDGAGVYINDGSALIGAAQIIRNTADFSGGGLYVVDGSTTVSRTVIARNAADDGGGIFRDGGGSLDLVNTTISENEASHGSGGGLRNDGGVTNLIFVTVAATRPRRERGGSSWAPASSI